MSVKTLLANLEKLPKSVAVPNYPRDNSDGGHACISASAIFTARTRRSISTGCSTPAKDATGRSLAPACSRARRPAARNCASRTG